MREHGTLCLQGQERTYSLGNYTKSCQIKTKILIINYHRVQEIISLYQIS